MIVGCTIQLENVIVSRRDGEIRMNSVGVERDKTFVRGAYAHVPNPFCVVCAVLFAAGLVPCGTRSAAATIAQWEGDDVRCCVRRKKSDEKQRRGTFSKMSKRCGGHLGHIEVGGGGEIWNRNVPSREWTADWCRNASVWKWSAKGDTQSEAAVGEELR